MLGGGEPDRHTGKEPLLADETVPLEFLPSDESRGKSKLFGVALIALIGVTIIAAIGVGAAQEEAAWAPELEPFVEFVENERGLQFVRPVGYVEIASSAVRPEFSDETRCQIRGVTCASTEAYRLLGVNSTDPASYVDLETLLAGLDRTVQRHAQPVAFYEPGLSPRIVLENAELFPEELLAPIIVHELVHALQDQHNLLINFNGEPDEGRPDFTNVADESSRIDQDTDRGRINLAVTEGDATRIENAYIDQLDPEDRTAVLRAKRESAQSATDATGPNPIRFYTDTTYALGEAFADLVVAEVGQDGLNAELNVPSFASNDVFVDVLGELVQPTVDAAQIINLPESVEEADGRIGSIGWFVALAPLVGVDQAFDAVIGYDDDAWAIYDNPDVQRTSPLRTCLRSDLFFDSGDEASEFADVISELAFRVDLDVARRSVTLDVCDELRDADLQTPAVMIPLIAANHLAAHHLDNGETTNLARCAAISQAKTIPIDLTFDEFNGYDVFLDDAEGFAQGCR